MDNRTVHKIAAERQRFDAGEPVDTQIIKPVILESWERSRAYGVNPQNVKKLVLSQEELRHRISQRQEVYDAAVPFLEKLYQFTSGSGFVSVLADEEGYVLKILGDYDAQKKVGDYLLVEGCNRSEQHIGTNGIGTCLATGAPIQVWGNEHYYSPHSDVVCSGAPIFDAEGRLAGCLDLTGLMDKVHYHTLGMVFSAAQAITKQLEMQKTYRDLLQTKNQMSVIIENIQTGLLLLDEDGRILQISTYAAQLLGEAKEAIVGKNISHYIRRQDIDFSHLKGDLTDRPIELGQGDGARRVFASVYKVSHTSSPGRGLLSPWVKSKLYTEPSIKSWAQPPTLHFRISSENPRRFTRPERLRKSPQKAVPLFC